MRKLISSLFQREKIAKSSTAAPKSESAAQSTPTLPPDGMEGLIKMKEAMQLIIRTYRKLPRASVTVFLWAEGENSSGQSQCFGTSHSLGNFQ